MIDSLVIKNFQSHDSSNFHFHPGVNAIIGPTDNGKSASLRALRWIIFNKPQGAQYISHWNRKKNGDPKDITSATVTIDGTTLSRERSPEGNGYKLDTRFLTSVGKGVPDEVSTILKIDELNIARQHDAPFLLCSSGGEVATYLNSLVHLDTIDRAYSSADSIKRSVNKELVSLASTLEQANSSLLSLGWVAKAEPLVVELKSTQEALRASQDTHASISLRLSQLADIKETLAKEAIVEKALSLMEARAEAVEEWGAATALQSNILNRLSDLADCKKTLEKAVIVEEATSLIAKINKRKETIQALLTEREKINTLMEELGELRKQIEDDTASLKLWGGKLPDTCPLCGK
jgi:exonuclease SbcC